MDTDQRAHLEHIIKGFPSYKGISFYLIESEAQPGEQHKSPGPGWMLPSAREAAAFLIARGGYSTGVIATRTTCAYAKKDGLASLTFADGLDMEGNTPLRFPTKFFDPASNSYFIPAGEPILSRLMSCTPRYRHVDMTPYAEAVGFPAEDLTRTDTTGYARGTDEKMAHALLGHMTRHFARWAGSFPQPDSGEGNVTIYLESPESLADLQDGDTLVHHVKLETSVESVDMWRKRPIFSIWANGTEGDRCLWVKRE